MGTSMASPHVAGVAALVVGEGVTESRPGREDPQGRARASRRTRSTTPRSTAPASSTRPAAILKARAETGGWQLGLGLLMAGAVAASARRAASASSSARRYLAGVLVGASGLFFLPYLAPALSSLPVIHALTHGLPSWDLSRARRRRSRQRAVLQRAHPARRCSRSATACRKLRGVLAGLAIGVAAHLAFFAVGADGARARRARASARCGSRSTRWSASRSRASRCAASVDRSRSRPGRGSLRS